MDVFETLVMQYVTRRPHVFISPQYSIDDEWSCPDFVALDFKAKVFSVVEVSSAYRPAMLINKVREREAVAGAPPSPARAQWGRRWLLASPCRGIRPSGRQAGV